MWEETNTHNEEETDAHQPRKSSCSGVNDGNNARPAPIQIEMRIRYMGKPPTHKRSINHDGAKAREYAIERIVGHTEISGSSHYVVH